MSVEYKTIDPEFFYKQFNDEAQDLWSGFERLKRDKITNKTDEGEYLENLLINFLKRYLPKKLSVGRGYIMNEEGKTSLQQDIVIFNSENYILLKNTDGFQVFPIECVYSTVEVKSTLSKPVLRAANKNVQSIKYLSGTRLKVEVATGDIVDLEQYGSVIFSSLFAFRSNSSLETCANNFEELNTAIDFICILDKGIICHFDNEEKVGDEHVVVRTTTTPEHEKDGIIFFHPKNSGPSALVLASWLEHIISHIEKHGESKGKYSMYNYLKIPPATYSVGYRQKVKIV